jgi:hypothetical protein
MACKTAAAAVIVVVAWAVFVYAAIGTLCDDLPEWA